MKILYTSNPQGAVISAKKYRKKKMLDGLTKGPEVARVTDALRRIKKARDGGEERGGGG